MTELTRDNDLEALIAEHIYHRDAEIIDIGYGFTGNGGKPLALDMGMDSRKTYWF